MKTSVTQLIFAPLLVVSGFALLFSFQNCSREVAFNGNPSLTRPGDLIGNDIDPGGFTVGGDTEVIIRFNETPRDQVQNDEGSVIDYEVVVPGGERPRTIRCILNGREVDCNQVGRIPVPTNRPGDNSFVIEVEIDSPTTGGVRVVREEIEWTVFPGFTQRTKTIEVQAANNQVDVIINVDNSGSMEYEQQSMAGRIANLVGVFAELDYNIAVITTSPIGDSTIWKASLPYVDGKFLELAPNAFCARKSTHSRQQTEQMIQNNVVRDLYLRDDNGQIMRDAGGNPLPEGNGWERGIFTTFRSVERSRTAGSPEAQCLRAGVPKHVVLISDERETLADDRGGALNDLNKSNPDEIRRLFATSFPGAIFKFHSIIVNPFSPEGEACLASHGAKPGLEYGRLSRETGGVIGSVCAEDYGAQLGRIGQLVLDSRLSYTLDCQSVMGPDVPRGQVINLATGQAVNAEFRFVGDKIEFRSPLPAGRYQVVHYCFNR